MENKVGNYIRVFIWHTPKKNHNSIMQLCEPAKNFFKNVGVQQEIFLINANSDEQNEMSEKMGFTNIAKAISSKEDKEVWLELQFYEDQKHLDLVSKKMNEDESAGKLGKQFMDLITPGSCVEGWFSHLKF